MCNITLKNIIKNKSKNIIFLNKIEKNNIFMKDIFEMIIQNFSKLQKKILKN